MGLGRMEVIDDDACGQKISSLQRADFERMIGHRASGGPLDHIYRLHRGP